MELDIKILPDGTLSVHIEGVKGKACLEVAELFKKLVGPQQSQKLTGEYYENDAHVTRDLRNL
ncbi:MAG: DUF2997 domain-containing protein [Elusimicrobiota bacterium]|mgnify:CR=1 FL=1